MNSNASVIESLQLMADKNIGALMIIDDGKLVGIFSERDYARRGILKGRTAEATKVGELMTSDIITVSPTDNIETCLKLMTDHHFRHLPVFEGDKLVGVISIGDVVKNIISQQEYTIQEMENYITGKTPGL
ncbi:MAG: CBS domain-containing protein [Anaerolineae bacterium]|nr:CBS domain-containing protein [Anaerolineae bacterium]